MSWSPAAPWPPPEIEQAVADELAQPKYRVGAPWWTRLVEWLQRMWTRFVEWLAQASEAVGGPIVLALLVGAVVVALAVVVTLNLGRRRARSVDARLRREHEAARGLDPDQLEAAARLAEERQEHAEAMRLLFRAALIRLDRAGLIELRPGTTSGTIAEAIADPGFARLATRFDAVVYGGRPATPDDPRRVRELMTSLLSGSRS